MCCSLNDYLQEWEFQGQPESRLSLIILALHRQSPIPLSGVWWFLVGKVGRRGVEGGVVKADGVSFDLILLCVIQAS